MRRLLYIPIIHSEADMGSAGAVLAARSATAVGEGRWRLHLETVARFWESIRAFLLSFEPRQLKVYQDGLAAAGERARHIVEEAARRGSPNYLLILELLNAGAELRQTEDPALLLREHRNLLGLIQPEGSGEGWLNAGRYRRQRDQLMESRDKFIAGAIGATLKEGEVGALFVGTYHSVESRLVGDISVEALKDPDRVRAYFEGLFLGHHEDRLQELAKYLTSPVSRV